MKISQFKHSNNLAEVRPTYSTKVKAKDRAKIENSQTCFNILKKVFNTDTIEYTEEFIILLLNRKMQVLGWVKISSGGIAGTAADPKTIFSIALQTAASAIVLAHNHPSGSTEPSQTDRDLTRRLVNSGKFLDIAVLDHIIIANDSYYSFADQGLI